MASFFNRDENNNPKLDGRESAVPSGKLISEEGAITEEEVQTALSIHPEWQIPKEDQYAYQFLNMECVALKPNQISLSGISIMEEDDKTYRVTAFIRNSLDRPIQFGDMVLALFDEDEKLLGRKAFDLRDVGEIPPKSSRPWHFIFTHKDLFKTDLPLTGWMLTFLIPEAPKKHELDLPADWKKALSKDDKLRLKEMVDSLEVPKPGEVNFMGMQASPAGNGDLHITMLIRNGNARDITIEKLPLNIEDANGELVATGAFTFKDLVIKGNTSMPYALSFPKSSIVKNDADFSTWKVYPPEAIKQ